MSLKINQREIVKEARMSLIRTEPFYASILLGLKLIETKSIRTFSVNAVSLKFNPDFAAKLTFNGIKVVLRHEVLHLVLKHHLRGSKIPDYVHSEFNKAADLALNCEIFHYDGFPDDALLPGRDEYKDLPFGRSAEDYYKMIMKKNEEESKKNSKDEDSGDSEENDSGNPEDSGNEDKSEDSGDSEENDSGNPEDSGKDENDESEKNETEDDSSDGNDGEKIDENGPEEGEGSGEGNEPSNKENDAGNESGEPSDGESGDDGNETEVTVPDPDGKNMFGDFDECDETDVDSENSKIERMIMNAVAAAQEAGGHVPSMVKELLPELIGKPKANWKVLLRNALSSNKRHGVNWKVPSRRVQKDGFIMPSRKIKTAGNTLWVIDTSGSMNVQDFNDAMVEAKTALGMMEKMDLWQFDTAIRDKRVIGKNDRIEDVEMNGRGGTDFQCVIDEIIKTNARPKLLIVMTDMGFSTPVVPFETQLKKLGLKVIFLNTRKNGYYSMKINYGMTINLND